MLSRLNRHVVTVVALLVLMGFGAARPLPAAAPRADQTEEPSGLKFYQSPYYDVYSDLEPERVQEAILRMTRMAEEYHDRTREFSGVIRSKFPFYLFRNPADYYAAGGLPGSAGVFMVRGGEAKLMAIAGEKDTGFTWHVVQHEGFHQFAHAVIGGQLPPWLNEGLADYFGEGIYTGDGMVTGLVPPRRCKKVQEAIRGHHFKSVKNMMLLSGRQWNSEMDGTNYDMAWSMVHFLAHGDNGKYQQAFSSFVREIGRNRPWDKAWEDNFGSADGFEKRWSDWWLAQDPWVTRDLYVKATVSTMASYVGRAAIQKQTFDNLDEFTAAAKAGTIKIGKDDWLPPTLIQSMLSIKDQLGKDIQYKLATDPKGPQVLAIMADGTRLVATFNRMVRTGPGRVTVLIDDLVPAMAKAKQLIADKKKADAKTVLLDSLKRNPNSPSAAEARKLLVQTR
jgi:hypothetical protein